MWLILTVKARATWDVFLATLTQEPNGPKDCASILRQNRQDRIRLRSLPIFLRVD